MKCWKVKRLLGKYLDKELTDKKIISLVEEHLDRCAACRQELESLVLMKELISGKERLTVGEDFWPRLKNQLEIKPVSLSIRWVNQTGDLARKLIPVPVAIMILVMVLLSGRVNQLSYINDYIFGDLTYEEINMLNENYDFGNWLNEQISYGTQSVP
jgi:predicted anti-sigma-YlaC factor YlaD